MNVPLARLAVGFVLASGLGRAARADSPAADLPRGVAGGLADGRIL